MSRALQLSMLPFLSACTLISLDSLQDGIASDGGNGGAGASNPDGGSTNNGASSAGGDGGGGNNAGGEGGSGASPAFEECILADMPAVYFRMSSPSSMEANLGTLGGQGRYTGSRTVTDGLIEEDDGASTFGTGGSLELDDVSSLFGAFKPFSIELWVQVPDNFVGLNLVTLSAGSDYISVELRRREARDGSDALWLHYDGPAGERQVFHNLDLLDPANQVHHLVAVYRQTDQTVFDGSGTSTDMALYLDGALVEGQANGDLDAPAPTIDAPLRIGTDFVGILDEVAVYDYELTSAVVADHYGYGTGAEHCD